MDRRGLLKTIGGLVGVVAVGASAQAEPKKYGCLTVNGHHAHKKLTGENLRVYLDGVEVQGVYEADDVEGYALVFCQDEQHHRDWSAKGHIHLKHGEGHRSACQMHLTGNIVIKPGLD